MFKRLMSRRHLEPQLVLFHFHNLFSSNISQLSNKLDTFNHASIIRKRNDKNVIENLSATNNFLPPETHAQIFSESFFIVGKLAKSFSFSFQET